MLKYTKLNRPCIICPSGTLEICVHHLPQNDPLRQKIDNNVTEYRY